MLSKNYLIEGKELWEPHIMHKKIEFTSSVLTPFQADSLMSNVKRTQVCIKGLVWKHQVFQVTEK